MRLIVSFQHVLFLQKEGEKGKAENAPLLSVPFTSELGNVTPVFITPAKWTQEEMVKAAQTIAFGTTLNAGCNCLSPKVIVMSDQWPQVCATSSQSYRGSHSDQSLSASYLVSAPLLLLSVEKLL